MKPKIGILGKGNVGSALKRGLERSGYQVRTVGKDPEGVRETAAWGDILVLAVPFPAVDDVLRGIGDAANGKTLVDATNPLTQDFQLALGFTTSAAEELQKKVPNAKIVKAFNTIFAHQMDSGRAKNGQLTLFAAGGDAEAKSKVLALGRDIGFDTVEAGPLQNARWLESLAYLNMQLAFAVKVSTDIGFKLVH